MRRSAPIPLAALLLIAAGCSDGQRETPVAAFEPVEPMVRYEPPARRSESLPSADTAPEPQVDPAPVPAVGGPEVETSEALPAAQRRPRALSYEELGLDQPATSPQTESDSAVRLLDPGGGELRELRFKVEKNHVEDVRLVMTMGLELATSKEKLPEVKLPPLALTMHFRVTDVAPNGDFRYEVSVTEAEVLDTAEKAPYEVRRAMEKGIGICKGLSGAGVVSSRGITRSLDFDQPKDAPREMADFLAQIRNSAGQVSAPLPKEPVGEGARWTVGSTVHAQSVEVDQLATYQLLKRTDDEARILVQVKQTARKQVVPIPQGGGSLHLLKLVGNGNGRIILKDGLLGPEYGMLGSHTEFDFDMSARGQTERLGMKLALKLEINPVR